MARSSKGREGGLRFKVYGMGGMEGGREVGNEVEYNLDVISYLT